MSTDTSANRTWQTLSTQADSMARLINCFSQQSIAAYSTALPRAT